MITLIGALFMMLAMGLLLAASLWCVPVAVIGGLFWFIGDRIDDDLAFLGGVFIIIFFLLCTYIVFRQAVIWLTDLVMWLTCSVM
ncbi:MAG: hypothetical protein ACYS7Y_32035 [Planctomycetota bacterium]|jgi:hypothetical protein